LDGGTEDGFRPNSILVYFHGGLEFKRPAESKLSFDVPAGTQDILVMADGYVPEFVAKAKQFKSGDVVEHQLMLSRGTPTRVRIVDQDGEPISKAGVRSYVTMVKPDSKTGHQFGSVHRANADVLVDVNLPDDTERISLSVFKSGYSSFKVESPKVAEPIEVKLKKLPATKGVVRDHKGVAVVGAEVYHLGRSNRNQVSGNIGNRAYRATCAKTDSEGAFSTHELSPDSFHTLLVESSGQRGLYVVKGASTDLELKLLPPRDMTFKFEGDLSHLNPRNLMAYQNCYGENGSGHALVELPHLWDRENQILKVRGILDGNFQISAGDLGELFETSRFEEGQTEVVVKYDPPELLSRTVKVSFESGAGKVRPRGLIGFREREIGFGGTLTVGLVEYRKIKDGVATIETTAPSLSIESDGLVGYAGVKEKVMIDLKDVPDKGTQNVTVEVELAGAIRGIVLDADGKPVVARVECSYQRRDGRSSYFQNRQVDSNGDGKFVLTPVHFGTTVKIRVIRMGMEGVEETVKVVEDNPIQDVEIVMPAAKRAKLGSK